MLGQVGLGVGAHVVVCGRLVEARHQCHRIVEHRDHVWEGVAEEPGDTHRDVDPRSAEFGQVDRLEIDHPA